MHRSSLRGRVAPLVLAALVLGMPAAVAAETDPSPSASASASSATPSTSPSPSATSTPRSAAGLPPAAGTSWTEGVCAPDADGVTAVVDLQGSAAAVARCVTSTGGPAYSSTNALQTFADAGFDVLTKATSFGPQICQVDGAPSTDPCAAWTGVWWSFWTGTDAGWKQAMTGAHETAAPTGTFVGLSLVDNVDDAPEPRVDTTPATSTPTPTPTVSVTPTPEPSTPVGPGRADLASDWLVSRAAKGDGTYDLQSFGFNPGLMIDMLFALVAEDPKHEAIPGLWASIEKQIPEWVDFTADNGTRYVDGPSAAKAMLAAEAVRDDVHDVGGLDVAKTVESKIDDDGKVLDYGDAPAYGFGQTLAVLALARADALDTKVLDAMLTQQCPSGGFRLSHGASCTDDKDSGVDATAMGLQAMLAAERSGVDVADADLTRAVGYLTSAAKTSGGWANDAFTTTVNTNSTGLAVQALQAYLDEHPGSAAAEGAVTKGRAWVAGLQVLPATGAAAATNVGAIAYSPEAFAAGPATSTDQWERATPQAMLAFGLPGFDTLVVAAAPTTTPTPTPTTSASSSATPTGGTTDPTTPATGGSGDGTAGGSGTDAGSGSGSGSGEGLAYTGAELWPALAVALLLLLAGAGFVLVSRRRGVHA
ncbi:hypothetical protein ACOCJ5_01195 [Knoellia sp. CPCC 206450]|uniref:hypothetical protein n=1 Tax=Knoellia tibetensis TaxID=3404798 RepID=UPI003B43BCED